MSDFPSRSFDRTLDEPDQWDDRPVRTPKPPVDHACPGPCVRCAEFGIIAVGTKEAEDIHGLIRLCDACYDLLADRAACSDPDCDHCRRGVTALGVKVDQPSDEPDAFDKLMRRG